MVLVAYAALFHLLLAHLPARGELPGNCDTWLVIALSKVHAAHVAAAFSGESPATAMFPVEDVHAFGEAAPGCASLFLLMRGLTGDDVVGYYFYICSILALTGFGVYLLARRLGSGLPGSFLAGLGLACSNFTFANIDDSIVVFWLPACLALGWFIGWAETGNRRHLLLAAAAGGLQVLFSVYVFFYQTLALLVVLGFHLKQVNQRRDWRWLLPGMLAYLAFPVLYLLQYIAVAREGGYVNPFGSLSVLYSASLGLADLGRALPENLLYPAWPDPREEFGFWVLVRRHAFSGLLLWCLAVWGAVSENRGRSMLLVMAALGLFLALGPFIQVGDAVGYSPLYFLHTWLPQTAFLRVPLRGYFLTLLVLSLLAARGADRLLAWPVLSSRRRAAIAVAALLAVHLCENAPLPVRGFAGTSYATPASGYVALFENQADNVVLDLPSSIGTDFSVSGDDLFPYNREIIYMNWQTYHGQNIMGGVNGYYPRHRVELQPHIDGIPRLIPLANLALAGLTHLAYHKNMRLRGEPDLLPRLARSRFLTRLFDDDAIAVFGLDLGQMRDTAELLYGTRDLEKVAGAGGGDGPRRYDSRRPDFVPPALRR
jgi:hypothetical protein